MFHMYRDKIVEIKYFLQRKYDVRVLAKSEYLLDSQSRWHVLCSIEKICNKIVGRKQEAHKRRGKQEENFQHQEGSFIFPSYVNEYENSCLRKLKIGPFPRRKNITSLKTDEISEDIVHIVAVVFFQKIS